MADPYDAYWAIVLVLVVPLGFSVAWAVKHLWRRVRLYCLDGGVTTLTQSLDNDCALCQEPMEAGEKVRTLSCDHAFHCGGIDGKCEGGVDRWLLYSSGMTCPIFRKTFHPVQRGKQPPRTSPAPSPSTSAPALQQLPRTSSTQDLEEGLLLPPAHDEAPPEGGQAASSSVSVPPQAQTQLPRTSTPDLKEASPPPADDEIVQEDSSSQ